MSCVNLLVSRIKRFHQHHYIRFQLSVNPLNGLWLIVLVHFLVASPVINFCLLSCVQQHASLRLFRYARLLLLVVKALIKFFCRFGLPKVVQTDQGTNLMSRLFAQVLKKLDVTYAHSSAYHPESQEALEWFHQTLKSMLQAYCMEFEKDWDEGVPLMLFAVREVVQESVGFRPSELVFAHSVHGPFKLLKERWLGEVEPQNLLDWCLFSRRWGAGMTVKL